MFSLDLTLYLEFKIFSFLTLWHQSTAILWKWTIKSSGRKTNTMSHLRCSQQSKDNNYSSANWISYLEILILTNMPFDPWTNSIEISCLDNFTWISNAIHITRCLFFAQKKHKHLPKRRECKTNVKIQKKID